MSRMLFERAQRYLGIQEVAGLRDHPLIRWWHSLCTIGETSDQVPWCSSFVNGVCWDERRSRSKSAAARSWLDFGSDGGSIRLLGGNQGNTVSIAKFAKGRIIGVRRV